MYKQTLIQKNFFITGSWGVFTASCWLVDCVSASHAVGHEFVSRPGHTNDHQKWYKLPPSMARMH